MTEIQHNHAFADPVSGALTFKVFSFDDNSHFEELQRSNYYSIIWIIEGRGQLVADFATYDLRDHSIFMLAPYQPFLISPGAKLRGRVVQFHADFFYIHKHHRELACNAVLFNNVYSAPYIRPDAAHVATFDHLYQQMCAEARNEALAQGELLASYLKIFLITAARIKSGQNMHEPRPERRREKPPIVNALKEAIETHFSTKHKPTEYAGMLNVSAKTLSRVSKAHFNKTVGGLIAERIIIEAKRELYLTSKQVKQIAFDLGYTDEFYFSRFFKTHTEVSPQKYRATVGYGRAELV